MNVSPRAAAAAANETGSRVIIEPSVGTHQVGPFHWRRAGALPFNRFVLLLPRLADASRSLRPNVVRARRSMRVGFTHAFHRGGGRPMSRKVRLLFCFSL